MPTAATKRYWDSLPDQCVCGASAEQIHHIIHVNGQRISKDDMLVLKLCAPCHRAVHADEREFSKSRNTNPVELATLRRHNFEVRAR